MLTMYCKILMDSRNQMEEMYESLGIERVWDPEYPEVHAAQKAHRVRYSERLGSLLIRVGEKLLRSALNKPVAQEFMS